MGPFEGLSPTRPYAKVPESVAQIKVSICDCNEHGLLIGKSSAIVIRHLLGQFHQHFTSSFYKHISQKRQKDNQVKK